MKGNLCRLIDAEPYIQCIVSLCIVDAMLWKPS